MYPVSVPVTVGSLKMVAPVEIVTATPFEDTIWSVGFGTCGAGCTLSL